MDKISFVKKNLINYYRQEFSSVWNLSEQSYKDKLILILKELDKDPFLRNSVVDEYLSSNDLFTSFVGAFLSICFGNNISAGFFTFKKILRLYKNTSPTSLEGRLCFYVQSVLDTLNERGYITAYDEQITIYTAPIKDILSLKKLL